MINPSYISATSFTSPSSILLLAACLDYIVGDPKEWLHPVQLMGWLITQYSQLALKICPTGWPRRCAGLLLSLMLILGSGLAGWLLIMGLAQIYPGLKILMTVILLASCFAGRSLRAAVEDVIQPLTANKLIQARRRLSYYVGRDTAHLSQSEISRALLETVAENAVDGVTAPLFYAILGSFTPLGAVPLALGYKAASTLDSMIGYRREPYSDLGWFCAQLEDYLTWLPCRLTVITLSVLSTNPSHVWSICRRDAIQDPSPNSGWSEAAYAATLQVQLGGTNTYQGIVTKKPLLGDATEKITISKIYQALQLTRFCFLLWLAIAIIMHYIINNLVFS